MNSSIWSSKRGLQKLWDDTCNVLECNHVDAYTDKVVLIAWTWMNMGRLLNRKKKIQANQYRFKWVATWLTGKSVYTNLFVELFITCIACHLGSEQPEDKPRKQSPVCQSCHKLLTNFVGHALRKIMYGNAIERIERQNRWGVSKHQHILDSVDIVLGPHCFLGCRCWARCRRLVRLVTGFPKDKSWLPPETVQGLKSKVESLNANHRSHTVFVFVDRSYHEKTTTILQSRSIESWPWYFLRSVSASSANAQRFYSIFSFARYTQQWSFIYNYTPPAILIYRL